MNGMKNSIGNLVFIISMITIVSCFVILCNLGAINLPIDEVGHDLIDFPNRSVLISFLIDDATDENKHVKYTYDCKGYAIDLKKGARSQGYRIRAYTIFGSEQMDEYSRLIYDNFRYSLAGVGKGHVLCKAYIVDEDLWVTIEPQHDLILNCTIGDR